ncbi:MAG TPA: IS66 family insertion sequence element accessory protein TnpB, partial [Candidatus Limnocylindria bacterium]|nr:IS66 family insertion sequence element accessory protein TnpB [Candidatus Limnocylindria bacterium]
VWDGSGLWVCTKRLEKSTFGWPTGEGPSRCLRPEELNLLIHGWEGTRHPKLGAAEQSSVAVREPSRNQRLTKSPTMQNAGAALSVNLLKIQELQKPEATKEKSFAAFSARSRWLFCNLLSGSRHTNKRLEAG